VELDQEKSISLASSDSLSTKFSRIQVKIFQGSRLLSVKNPSSFSHNSEHLI